MSFSFWLCQPFKNIKTVIQRAGSAKTGGGLLVDCSLPTPILFEGKKCKDYLRFYIILSSSREDFILPPWWVVRQRARSY